PWAAIASAVAVLAGRSADEEELRLFAKAIFARLAQPGKDALADRWIRSSSAVQFLEGREATLRALAVVLEPTSFDRLSRVRAPPHHVAHVLGAPLLRVVVVAPAFLEVVEIDARPLVTEVGQCEPFLALPTAPPTLAAAARAALRPAARARAALVRAAPGATVHVP